MFIISVLFFYVLVFRRREYVFYSDLQGRTRTIRVLKNCGTDYIPPLTACVNYRYDMTALYNVHSGDVGDYRLDVYKRFLDAFCVLIGARGGVFYFYVVRFEVDAAARRFRKVFRTVKILHLSVTANLAAAA